MRHAFVVGKRLVRVLMVLAEKVSYAMLQPSKIKCALGQALANTWTGSLRMRRAAVVEALTACPHAQRECFALRLKIDAQK
jgi:hypothetical protein